VKKVLKIGQYLETIWTKVYGLLFGPPCTSSSLKAPSHYVGQGLNK